MKASDLNVQGDAMPPPRGNRINGQNDLFQESKWGIVLLCILNSIGDIGKTNVEVFTI